MEAHKKAVEAIEASIRNFSEHKRPFRIYHGSTNSTRDSHRYPGNSVDTSKLNNVIHIDTDKRTAIVEPNVPMDDFVQATLAEGLIPLVVMEFPGITVGGGFSGTSGESSSFRSGYFDNTVNWIEIVLARGETTFASRTNQPDIFWGSASSFGSLGVVTLLEIRLRPSAPWVKLTYLPFASMSSALEAITTSISDPSIDYLDGIAFSRNEIILCLGTLHPNPPPPGAEISRFTRPQDPWFYLHAQRRTASSFSSSSPPAPVTIYVPISDYLFRYDRGAFWIARHAFRYFLAPFNRVTRFLFDRFFRTRVMYHALHASGQSRIYVIQDVAIPFEKSEEFHGWLDETLGIYPVWLCPLRQRRDGGREAAGYGLYGALADGERTPEYMLNFGVWGKGSRRRKEFVRQNRELERKVGELGGRKWLYAHAYYTEEEFWGIYDRGEYEGLREKYGAGYLPSVYDKVKVDLEAEERASRSSWVAYLVYMFWNIWPLSGLYGVYAAWVGGEYLLQKKKPRVSVQAVKEE